MVRLLSFIHRVIAFPSLAQTEAGTGPILFSFPIYRVDGKRHLEFRGRTVTFRSPLVLLAMLVLAVSAFMSITAATTDSTTVAVNIATIVLTIAAPFLPLAQLHFDGKTMVAISMILALAIAIVANFVTGDLKVADLSGGVLPLFIKFGLVWGGMQAVYQTFKDSLPQLTTTPLLVTPPPPKPAAP
jgi:hypothetical protein